MSSQNDQVLERLIAAPDAASREQELESILMESVQPVVDGVLSSYGAPSVRPEDAEDLAATIHLRVVRRLQQLTTEDEPIQRLDDYVATVAYSVVSAFLRARYPARTRLKNRLRYLLSHDPRFALWQSRGEMVCGLKEWRSRNAVPAAPAAAQPSRRMLDRDAPGEALRAIFERCNGPLRFEDLVRLTAELWQVVEPSGGEPVDRLQSDARSPAAALEMRETIATVWRELRLLRGNQRAALLLNLRDLHGTNGLVLLLVTGLATFDEIAQAISVTPERLSALWNDLPLDDLTIAEILNVSRQGVINLRKAARERLARRTAELKRRKR